VARACQTFEESLGSLLNSGRANWEHSSFFPADSSLGRAPNKILVHPHCHQRSLVGIEPTLVLMRLIPGAEIVPLDAGCCGMAGSFGYENEHYEVSRQVGEQRLFPAVRRFGEDTAIVAPGFSCRMQIAQFTGRRAVHPGQLLSEQVVNRLVRP
jgi:Fe-S oxidoreductase